MVDALAGYLTEAGVRSFGVGSGSWAARRDAVNLAVETSVVAGCTHVSVSSAVVTLVAGRTRVCCDFWPL